MVGVFAKLSTGNAEGMNSNLTVNTKSSIENHMNVTYASLEIKDILNTKVLKNVYELFKMKKIHWAAYLESGDIPNQWQPLPHRIWIHDW